MKTKKYKNTKEGKADELTQVKSRLSHLENKLKSLLKREENEIKSELEIIIETSYEIIVDNHIKDKQKNKNKTKVNKKYLDKIIRECKQGVFVGDEAGCIKETNGKVETLLGYKKEFFRDLPLKSFFPLADRLETFSMPDDASSRHTYLSYVRKKYRLPPVETTILDNRNRKNFPFQVKATALKDSNDQLIGPVFLLKDISERKKGENEIKKEKDRLKELLETSKRLDIIERLKDDLEKNKLYREGIIESLTDGIIVIDTSGFINSVNKAFAKLLDSPPHELIGKHFAELEPLEDEEYPTNYGMSIKGRNGIKDLLKKQYDPSKKEEVSFETHIRGKDEIFVPVWCDLYWIRDKKGEITEGAVFIRDLTEKMLAERGLKKSYNELLEAKEYLENIISTSPDGIMITDYQGTITMVNEAIENTLCYTQDELNGMHSSELNPYFGDERYTQLRMDKLFKDGRVTGFEMIWKGKHGELIPIEINTALLKDKKGEFLGGVIAVRDIRERKRLEEMKTDFISNISHELRTPLTSIKGSIDNLLDGIAGKISDTQREYLSIINNESNRLVRLINDLLDLNKFEARSIKISPEEIEYISLVTQVVHNLKDLAYEKGLTLEMESSSSEIHIKADRDRINQVLINLINNAIKFTKRGGIKVIVENPGDQSITTRIRDTGAGIPRDELDKVFDKFYQVSKPSAVKSKGSGLGLAIAKKLIEFHGGTIWVESEEGKGSEFCFNLLKGSL